MTKEEYTKLLNSDYWKGYSYSIIKERNFTCEDCGAYYPGERNKLQVHHLVYRDIMPWSYKPEEMVVLCRECHQRRHGIVPTPHQEDSTYIKSYSSDSFVKDEKAYRTDRAEVNNRFWPKKRNIVAVLVLIILGVYTFFLASLGSSSQKSSTMEAESIDSRSLVENKIKEAANPLSETYRKTGKEIPMASGVEKVVEDVQDEKVAEYVADQGTYVPEDVPAPKKQKEYSVQTNYSSLDEKIHQQVVEQARRYGVSTEGTTSQIQERIIHQQVVEQARRYGVSTEGSTSQIQERIIHQQVVEQAKRNGVSTNGTTSQIQERIIHQQVVEQARRHGVSTEGTTSEIQERIIQKMMNR